MVEVWADAGELVRGGFADVPLIVEDLLARVEVLRATGGDPMLVAELLAQVELVQGR